MGASANVIVDAELHQRATEKLAGFGVSVEDAVRLMLHNVVEECGVPLSLHLPNAETRAAMDELESGHGVRSNSIEDLLRDLRA